MLNSGKKFRALRDKKNKYSKSRVVRKQISERNKKPQIVDIFFYKSYYQESNIQIIAFSSVVTVAEWLDGSFESQNRL